MDSIVLNPPSATPIGQAAPGAQPASPDATAHPTAESAGSEVSGQPSGGTDTSGVPTPAPMPNSDWPPGPRTGHRTGRISRRTSPNRPETPEQIAAFAKLWLDRTYTLEEIGRLYGVNKRTLQKWNSWLGLPPRDQPEDHELADEAVIGAITLSREMAPNRSAARELSNPTDDPEIARALEEIKDAARAITLHSDLASIHRKLSQLAVLVAAKAPAQSWVGLQVCIESLMRAILNARKVEARLPFPEADQVQLRKEAAAQLFREMRSVLSDGEQAELARLVKLGADRLMQRQAPPQQ